MDQNMKKKINTLGTVGNVLAILSRIVVIAGIVVLLLIGIAGLILPRDAVKVSMGGTMEIQVSEKLYEGRFPVVSNLEDADFDFDGQEYESVKVEQTDDGVIMSAEAERMEFDLRSVSKACLVGIVYLTAVLVMLYFLGSLMKEFKRCDTPFAEGVIRKMTNFAWSLIPMAVLSGFSGRINVGSLKALSMDLSYTINLSVVLVILVVFALVQVFKYGAGLQQQADETL